MPLYNRTATAMKPIFMKPIFLSLLFSFVLSSVTLANDLNISHAYIPEAPPGAHVMAGFMDIHNNSPQSIEIIGISSPAFNHVEMHLSKEVDGFAKMLPQKSLIIKAGQTLHLKSGSYHLMLIKPKQRLIEGDTTMLHFVLSNKEKFSVSINIKKRKTRTMKCAAGKCGGM